MGYYYWREEDAGRSFGKEVHRATEGAGLSRLSFMVIEKFDSF